MITQAIAATSAGCIVRKQFKCKPSNALLLGLLGVTLVSAFSGSKAFHAGAGMLLAAGIGLHCWNRRKAL